MLNIDISFKDEKTLTDYIDYVKKISSIKTDTSLQKFIQNKVLETVNMFSNQISGTTDDEWISEYKSNHKIREIRNGFVLYNDTTIPQSMLPIHESRLSDYPDGFCIAMAFEYGIGIIGELEAVTGAWEYNVRNWNFAWRFKKYDVTYTTYGYAGFEIYRKTANYTEEHLSEWLNEYFNK